MTRIALGIPLAALVLLSMGLVSYAEGPSARPGNARTLSFATQGVSIKGKLGSYCLPVGERSRACRDAAFDPTPTRGRLPVRPGGRIVIRTGRAAKLVNVQLIRTGDDPTAPEFTGKAMRALPVGASTRRWVVRLPADLTGANLVTGFVRYAFGDASFSARLSTKAACGAGR